MTLKLTPRVVTQHPVAITAVGLCTMIAGCFSGAEYDSTPGTTGKGGASTGAGATSNVGGAVGSGTGGVGVGGVGVGGVGVGAMGGASGAGTGAMAGAAGAGTGAMAGAGGAGTGAAGGAGGALGGAAGAGGTGPTYDCTGATVVCAGQAEGKACSGINQLGYLDPPSMQGPDGNDIWGWTDPMTGKEYALVGLNNGTAFVDVSNPCRPVHLGHLRTQTQNELWRDIKTYQNYAYIVAESSGHGLQVFDLTQLRNVVVPADLADFQPVVFEATNHLDSFGAAHNLALNVEAGFAYPLSTNNCPDGRSINLADPANPVDLGCWDSGSRIHDAQCVIYNGPDANYAGKEVCITGSEERGLFVYDMTDKANVTIVVPTVKYPNVSYSHQVWLTEDHHYLYMSDELDELQAGINMTLNIFDMSNLAAPVHVGQYISPMGNSDHQGYVRGNYFFLSAYSGGLRVLDISNPTTPVEVGYFDTYPENDVAGFDGQWSVYPYFRSGVLITNGIVKGLHVLEPNPAWLQDSQWLGW